MSDRGYKLLKLAMILTVFVVCMMLFCGCMPIESGVARGGGSIANPGNSLGVNLATGRLDMTNSTDTDAKIQDFSVTVPKDIRSPVAGATVVAKGVEFASNASKVRRANSGQLEAFAEYKLAEGEAAANVIDSVGDAGADILGGVARLRKSEKANQGYQVIFALFAFVLAMFCLIVFIALVAYGLKKLFAVLFPPKPSGSSDLLLSLITGLAGAKK